MTVQLEDPPTPVPRAPARRRPWTPGRWRTTALLVGPAVVVLAGVFIAALLVLAEFSLHRFRGGVTEPGYTVAEWTEFLTTSFVWDLVAETVVLGLITTAICAVVGYSTALALQRVTSRTMRTACYFAIFSPLLTSVVSRTYGWSLILGDVGFVNSVAGHLNLPGAPYIMMYERTAVVVALVHILLPFMVLPIVSSLRQIDTELPLASSDLGASGWATFRKVVFPLSLPGLIAGAQLTFALTISAFATPSLLGGGRVQVLATNIYGDVQTLNWPRASVGAFLLLALALLSLAVFSLLQRRLLARGGAG